MSRVEVFSPEGLRMDGRRFNDLRHFAAKTHSHPLSADGSCVLQMGNTQVLCLVRGPSDTLNTASGSNTDGLPTIAVSISSHDSGQGKINRRLRNDKRLNELANHIKNTMEQIIVSNIYARTSLEIQITVLANDGGLLAACCNATTLALIDAGVAVYDYVSACTIGVWDRVSLVDICGMEEADVAVTTVGVLGAGDASNARIGLLVAQDKMPMDRLPNALQVAIDGCEKIRQIMDEIVREMGIELVSKNQ